MLELGMVSINPRLLRKVYIQSRFILKRKLEVVQNIFQANGRHPFPSEYTWSAVKFIPIPEQTSEIFIDIGLSHSAPNSCLWLTRRPSSFVVAFEASPSACIKLAQNGMSVNQIGYRLAVPHGRCAIFSVAVGSEKWIELQEIAGDIGTSSTLKPTAKFFADTKYRKSRVVKVSGVSLDQILASISKNRFPLISGVKIDTQGSDLSIIKSGVEQLKSRVVYLSCEINTLGHYSGAPTPIEVEQYLNSIGFYCVKTNSIVDGEVIDATYVNNQFRNNASSTWWEVL
jgi:FkbM family methyltransferase